MLFTLYDIIIITDIKYIHSTYSSDSLSAGVEPARGDPDGCLVNRPQQLT